MKQNVIIGSVRRKNRKFAVILVGIILVLSAITVIVVNLRN